MPETVPGEVLNELRAALERDRWINTHKFPVAVKILDGSLVLEGTIEHVAAKTSSFRAGATYRR